ncbi:MAG: tol-pal system protein YbgF [Geobacteraceae bacterium]|nr:tol-pal system protein YbgF [Geobacteraceae bacterium]
MPFGIRTTAIISVCFVLTGCAANDLVVKRQSEAEAKIEHLIQSGKKSEQRQNELAAQIHGQDDRFSLTAAQLKQLQEAVQELRASQDELKVKVALLSQQVTTPKVEVVNPAPSSKTSRDSGPPADYVKAFGYYSANNFADAIKAFETFLKANPQSEYTANAIYWIGECHYSLSDLPRAREAFSRVTENHPTSPKAPDAMLKLGYTLAAMKEKDKALAIYENLIKSFPSSPAAVKARERLNSN